MPPSYAVLGGDARIKRKIGRSSGQTILDIGIEALDTGFVFCSYNFTGGKLYAIDYYSAFNVDINQELGISIHRDAAGGPVYITNNSTNNWFIYVVIYWNGALSI